MILGFEGSLGLMAFPGLIASERLKVTLGLKRAAR